MSRPEVSVIVPTLDEAETLERNLGAVLEAAHEVIVSDGGSSDATVQVANSLGARVVVGPQGRGPQLNRGAASATGSAFLFLHADTALPRGAVESVACALASGAVGGGFAVQFDSDRPIFRLGSAIVNLRTRIGRSPLGDQAQFVTRAAFEELGGYPEWPILEDLEFIRRLKRKGKMTILEPPVATSTRRFEEGSIARAIIRNWLIFALYFAGVSPQRLARLYRHVR